ncbi:MAG: response regulator [Phycisphaerae bacterium]|nr:response regulator [Phycisphaerae bacterium]
MTAEQAPKKVLLVDDDRDTLTAIQIALSDLGVNILTASDGNEAVAQADAHHPDLVVLDMMLPKRSGFLVMEKLKRGKKRGEPPRIIMITGNLGVRHRAYAESLGVDLYLHKPVRMDRLVGAIKELLA